MTVLSWVAVGLAGLGALGCLYWINELYRSSMPPLDRKRQRFNRASSWTLVWVGGWQWSLAVAMVLMDVTAWSSVIALFGAGAFLMFTGWLQWRTRSWRDSHLS